MGLPGGLVIKNPPAMQEAWVQSLGWEDPLEKEMAIHSSILAWEIPHTEKPGRLQSLESHRVRHLLATKQQYYYYEIIYPVSQSPNAKPTLGLISLFLLTLNKIDCVIPANQTFSLFLILILYPIKAFCFLLHFSIL